MSWLVAWDPIVNFLDYNVIFLDLFAILIDWLCFLLFFFLFGFIQIDIWLSQSFILIWLSQSMSLGGVTDLYQSSDLALWFPAIWVQFVKSISWVMLLIYISLSGSYSLISCYMNSVCYYTKYHKLTISLLFFIITLTIWI